MRLKIKTTKSLKTGILIFVFIIPFLSTQGITKDFTFNVPVEFKNIHPSLTHFNIGVVVKAKGYTHYVASNFRRIKFKNGAFSGVVTIEMDAFSGMDPAKADSWEVTLGFAKNNSTSVKYPSEWEREYPLYKIDRRAGFREEDNGRISKLSYLKKYIK